MEGNGNCLEWNQRNDIKEEYPMLKKRHYLYLDEIEYRVLIRSLVQMKNRLIHEGRFTDCVDELILKALSAPLKRI